MLIVLSPAKSLDFETPLTIKKFSDPFLNDEAASLIAILKNFDADQISGLMKISENLAKLNVDRFHKWSLYPRAHQNRQAVLAFNGDVYEGLAAKSLNLTQLNYLQSHLRILSGLYGVLRPLDLIQAYRLEMGSSLANARGSNLYAFWGKKISEFIKDELQNHDCQFLINLASEEYFKVLCPKLLSVPIITPIFQDYKNGQYKIISFFAKRARGLMVHYCAMNKISKPEKLKLFNMEGYVYCKEESDHKRWIFRRRLNE